MWEEQTDQYDGEHSRRAVGVDQRGSSEKGDRSDRGRKGRERSRTECKRQKRRESEKTEDRTGQDRTGLDGLKPRMGHSSGASKTQGKKGKARNNFSHPIDAFWGSVAADQELYAGESIFTMLYQCE